MYLLNRESADALKYMALAFTFHYVSIKSAMMANQGLKGSEFTFHYVSIKSAHGLCAKDHQHIHLHSTMYLLNLV